MKKLSKGYEEEPEKQPPEKSSGSNRFKKRQKHKDKLNDYADVLDGDDEEEEQKYDHSNF